MAADKFDLARKRPKVLCLVWAPFSGRMDELSAEIGADRKAIFTYLYGHMYLAPLRYFALFVRTALLLAKERPDVVYAQNPSVFCPLSCVPYCWLFSKKLVIDHHAVWSMKTFSSGALSRFIRKLEVYAVKRAHANTAPHLLWAAELEKMGAKRVLTVYDCVPKSEARRETAIREKYSPSENLIALAPHGGHKLERIEEEVEAVKKVGGITLLISGPQSKVQTRIGRIDLGHEARYIGFVPTKEYERLKASVDFGLSITDEPYTISHSLLEFASNSVPAISSDQEAVKQLFGDSLLYVKSSDPEDVAGALSKIAGDPKTLREYGERIAAKEDELILRRSTEIESLRNLVYGPAS